MMRILIPLDGSSLSRQVLPYVAHVFRADYAQLTFLRVQEPRHNKLTEPERFENWGALMRQLYASTQLEALEIYQSNLWEAFRDELTVDLEPSLKLVRDKGFHVDLLLSFGDPAKEIVRQSSNFDLIVMASKIQARLSRALFGSVTEQVLKYSQIPVLIQRPETTSYQQKLLETA